MKTLIVPSLDNVIPIIKKSRTKIFKIEENNDLNPVVVATRQHENRLIDTFNDLNGYTKIILGSPFRNEIMFWEGFQFNVHSLTGAGDPGLNANASAHNLEFTSIAFFNNQFHMFATGTSYFGSPEVGVGAFSSGELAKQYRWNPTTFSFDEYNDVSGVFFGFNGLYGSNAFALSQVDNMFAFSIQSTSSPTDVSIYSNFNLKTNPNNVIPDALELDTPLPNYYNVSIRQNETVTHISSGLDTIFSLATSGETLIAATFGSLTNSWNTAIMSTYDFTSDGYKVHNISSFNTVQNKTYLTCSATLLADLNLDKIFILVYEVNALTLDLTLISSNVKLSHNVSLTFTSNSIPDIPIDATRFSDGSIYIAICLKDSTFQSNEDNVFLFQVDSLNTSTFNIRLTNTLQYRNPGILKLTEIVKTPNIPYDLLSYL